MPTIYEYFRFKLSFHANDHAPIHVHVEYGEFESVLELIMDGGDLKEVRHRKVAGMDPLPAKDLKTAKKFVEKYAVGIVNKWVEFFVYGKQVTSTKITKRI